MKKKYTHIFFDLDNTLWDFEKNSKLSMKATFEFFFENLKHIDFETFFKVYLRHNLLLWSLYRKKQLGKKELTRLRFQNTFEELGISGINPDLMNTRYLNEMPRFNELINGTLEVLEYLKKKKYHLYIITNGFKEVQLKKLKSSGLEQFFSKVFISEEIKIPKPGREIFEHAIKSTNAKKKSSIMIGDDLDVDVFGATNFGIDAVHLNPNLKLEDTKTVDSMENQDIFFVKNISELQNLL